MSCVANIVSTCMEAEDYLEEHEDEKMKDRKTNHSRGT
jgi:hypothetical protein